jgi:hypothetical protein
VLAGTTVGLERSPLESKHPSTDFGAVTGVEECLRRRFVRDPNAGQLGF